MNIVFGIWCFAAGLVSGILLCAILAHLLEKTERE